MKANQRALEAQVGALTEMLRRALPFGEAETDMAEAPPPAPKRNASEERNPLSKPANTGNC